ncbi:MAG: hypothetical protein LUD72_06670 [Bacteroidales bacterium]|nr:hypothetical protein [Bacteroidales bacterium]
MKKQKPERYKDLTVGDSVEYKTRDLFNNKDVSGVGTVMGFGRSGDTHVVWVTDDYDNKVYGPTYDEVRPI